MLHTNQPVDVVTLTNILKTFKNNTSRLINDDQTELMKAKWKPSYADYLKGRVLTYKKHLANIHGNNNSNNENKDNTNAEIHLFYAWCYFDNKNQTIMCIADTDDIYDRMLSTNIWKTNAFVTYLYCNVYADALPEIIGGKINDITSPLDWITIFLNSTDDQRIKLVGWYNNMVKTSEHSNGEDRRTTSDDKEDKVV